MRKTAKLAGLLLLLIVAFTGCSKKKERVVIYSSAEEYRNVEMMKRLTTEFPDYQIELQYIPTGNHAAKIKAEGKNIEADIIHGLELSLAESLKNTFATLSNVDTSMYLDELKPEDMKYVYWEKYTASLIVDKKYFKDHNLELPKTYEDLLKPEFKELIAMPDPKTSGTGYMYVLNVINIMGEEKGFQYFDNLQKNIKQFTTSGSGPVNLLKQGEIAVAMGMTFQGVEELKNGADFKIIELETKTPYNYTVSSIIDGKETKTAVMEVFNYIVAEWNLYDKENNVPGKILKEQINRIENFPKDLEDADMTNIENIKTKEKLIEKWKY